MKTLFVFFVSMVLTTGAYGQTIDSVQANAWNNFKQINKEAEIRWAGRNEAPASVHGFISKRYNDVSSSEEVARQFLIENKKLFRMNGSLSDLAVLRNQDDQGTNHIDFQQLYNGIPVMGAEYSLAVKNNSIVMAGGTYFSNITCPLNPAISEQEAITIAKKDLMILDSKEFDIKTFIVPEKEQFYLAYYITTGQWDIIIDAVSGKIKKYGDRRLDVAIGNIWEKDPSSPYVQVTLPRIREDQVNSNKTLYGFYAKVRNWHPELLYFNTSNFNFTYSNAGDPYSHDQSHRDDVNAYYHIDKYANDYWLNHLQRQPNFVNVDVHNFADTYYQVGSSVVYYNDQAYAIVDSSKLYFGHGGSLFRDLAKASDVIYHEYTHIISSQIGLGYTLASSLETLALQEAYSDYHTASFTNDPRIGEWVVKCSSTGDLRKIANDKNYFNYNNKLLIEYAECANAPYGWLNPKANSQYPNGKPHTLSMIVSGAFWDIRQKIGADIADKLILKGLLYRHGNNTTFMDAREGIIQADRDLYSGTHVNDIKNAFGLRGIGETGLVISISGPTYINSYQCESPLYSAHVTGGTGSYKAWWGPNSTFGMSAYYIVCPGINNVYVHVEEVGGTNQGNAAIQVEVEGVGGCPYVFAENEHGLIMDNNILHRSEFKENRNKRIQDLYKLNVTPAKIDNTYILQIKELNSDHSYFDGFNLYAVDHASGKSVAVTEDNRVISYNLDELQLADEIKFDDGKIVQSELNQIDAAKSEVMHIKFSKDKINRLTSLAKSNGSQELALLIDFQPTVFALLPPKEEAGRIPNNSTLTKSKAFNSIEFARREQNSQVIIPLNEGIELDDIVIEWNRASSFGRIGIVPITEISNSKQLLKLRSANHKYGDVTLKVSNIDQKYAELDSSETINLTFEAPSGSYEKSIRSFILETNGYYLVPDETEPVIPKEFGLEQNYPNPFNPSTTIRYNLKENTKVTLTIYNTLGQIVKTLVDRDETAGIKNISWDGKDEFGKQVASGIYIYKLKAGNTVFTRKMLFIK